MRQLRQTKKAWYFIIMAAKLMDGSGFVVEGVPEKLSGKVVVPSSVQGLPVVGFTAKGLKIVLR